MDIDIKDVPEQLAAQFAKQNPHRAIEIALMHPSKVVEIAETIKDANMLFELARNVQFHDQIEQLAALFPAHSPVLLDLAKQFPDKINEIARARADKSSLIPHSDRSSLACLVAAMIGLILVFTGVAINGVHSVDRYSSPFIWEHRDFIGQFLIGLLGANFFLGLMAVFNIATSVYRLYDVLWLTQELPEHALIIAQAVPEYAKDIAKERHDLAMELAKQLPEQADKIAAVVPDLFTLSKTADQDLPRIPSADNQTTKSLPRPVVPLTDEKNNHSGSPRVSH